jgi:hypothetical protein
MDNQTLIVINIVLSAIIPIIANSAQECFRIMSRVKKSNCCHNEIEFNEEKKPPNIDNKV